MAFQLPKPLIKPLTQQAPQQPTTPKAAEVVKDSPRDSAPSEDKQHLGNGDFLVENLEQGSHKVQIIKRTDSSQFIPFLMKCSCGTEGRFHIEQQAKDFAYYHFTRHPR